MLRDCLQERKLPVVFAQSGSCQQLGEIFYPVPRCQWFWVGILQGLHSQDRQGSCLEAAQGSHQGLGSNMGEEGLTWLGLGQRVAAPVLLPLCCHPCKQVLADSQVCPRLLWAPHAVFPAMAVGNEVCPACAIICHGCAITLALLCWTQGVPLPRAVTA